MSAQAQVNATENGITRGQQRTLDAIRDYIDTHGIPPSIRDICRSLKLVSTSSVQMHFQNLRQVGAIEYRPLQPRSVRVLWVRPGGVR